MLREATRDCRVVVLCATESEAEPIRAALLDPETHVVATKTLHVGELAAAGSRSPGRPSTVRVVVAISGCDKANAAHILTCLLQAMAPPPALVIQAGIAGALPGAGPGPGAGIGDIVIATEEAYSDTGSSSPGGLVARGRTGPADRPGARRGVGRHLPLGHRSRPGGDGCHTGGRLVGCRASACQSAAAPEGGAAPESALWPTGVGRPGASPAVLLGTCVTASQVTGSGQRGR